MGSTARTRGDAGAPRALYVHRTLAVVAVTAALALVAAGCGDDDSDTTADSTAAAQAGAATGADTSNMPAITVSGEGRASGKPDLMTVNMGVEANAETANGALDEANVLATALIKTFKDLGVDSKDLQTSDLSIWPNWDSDAQRIVGYHVSNTLTVKLRDLDRAGEVIDTAAGAVGDAVRFNGVSFSIDDTAKIAGEARTDAVKRAADQAQQLADAAGVELGDLRSMDETGGQTPAPMYYGYSADQAMRGMAESVPIEEGCQEVTVQVVLVYDIAS